MTLRPRQRGGKRKLRCGGRSRRPRARSRRRGLRRQRAGVAAPPDSVHVDRDRAAERREPARSERLAPDPKEAAERRRAFVADDAAGIERPGVGAAACGDDAAETADALARARSPPGRSPRAGGRTARRGRAGRGSSGAGAAGEPRRPEISRAGDIEAPFPPGSALRPSTAATAATAKAPTLHRNQATRAAPLSARVRPPCGGRRSRSAKADGDPASDYLIAQQAFLSYDAKIPPALQRKLVAAVASANKNGFPGQGSADLEQLRPRLGARAVREAAGTMRASSTPRTAKCWWGAGVQRRTIQPKTRLVVVMPKGSALPSGSTSPPPATEPSPGSR